MRVFYLLLCYITTCVAPQLKAQQLAVKTNLLYDATATLHLGGEIRVHDQWTCDLSGNYNNWSFSHDKRWKQWTLQPEMRYWLCESFGGHFFGIHLQGGMYNIGNIENGLHLLGTDFSKISDARYQGWKCGGGFGYGYAWILNRHWNLETEIAVGYNYTRSDRYPCSVCGEKIESGKVHHYFGPTKLALNIVYIW